MSKDNIKFLYKQIGELMREALLNSMSEEYVVRVLDAYDFLLQNEYGFPEDTEYHRLSRIFLLKKQWVGRTFKCNDTGEEVTIPITVGETDFFSVGNGFVDVGRYGFYSRVGGNIVEVGHDN